MKFSERWPGIVCLIILLPKTSSLEIITLKCRGDRRKNDSVVLLPDSTLCSDCHNHFLRALLAVFSNESFCPLNHMFVDKGTVVSELS